MNNEESEKVIYNEDEDEELTSSLFGKNDIETDNKEEIEEIVYYKVIYLLERINTSMER